MKFTVLLLALVLCSCTTVFHSYIPRRSVIRNYTLNQTKTCSIGDPIARVQNGYVVPVYEVAFDYEPPSTNLLFVSTPNFTKGKQFDVFGEVDGDSTLILYDSTFHSQCGILITPSGYIVPGAAWFGVGKGAGVRGMRYGSEFTRERLFIPLGNGQPTKGSFKAEIIYSGLTGSTLRAIYREYVSDFVRPAFSIELQYNLDESKIIAYKSIQIEVSKATNSLLEYRVISDDDLPWMP